MRAFTVLAIATGLLALATLAPTGRAFAAGSVDHSGASVSIHAQDATPVTQSSADTSSDNTVTVMWSVFGVAAFAAIVLTGGYLLREQLGLVKPPPPQPDHDSHH